VTRPTRPVAIAAGVIAVVLVAVVVEVLRVHGGVAGTELASSWQLLDLDVLEANPFGGVWDLHTQPPVHNLVIGLIAWSPLPLAGTVFALYVASLAVMAGLLLDLLVRWRVPLVAATVVTCLAVADPSLLSTIRIASYEIPLAALVVGFVWTLDRYLTTPSARWLAILVGIGIALVMTRALFHPLWLAIVLAVVLLARRPPRRQVLAAVAVPLLVLGGWTAKNAVLVDSASLSSWTGFNLQRGVVGPMPETAVDEAIAAGDVSELAAVPPWQSLDVYAPWVGTCRPGSSAPALANPTKTVGAVEIANFNDECYLPLYRTARHDALTMIRREPGRYLADRVVALAISHDYTPLGHDGGGTSFLGEALPSTSWMDRLYSVLMVRLGIDVDASGWNASIFGDTLHLHLALPLLLATSIVLGRAILAAVRCWRGRAQPDRREVLWLVSGITVAFVIVGGDLVELGENSRFRSMLDPLLFGLVAVAVTDTVRWWRARGVTAQ